MSPKNKSHFQARLYRLLFMGTPAFSVPSLLALHRAGYSIPLLITQPDRPAGRGYRPQPTPVKVMAKRLSLPVFQPEKLRSAEVEKVIRSAQPDCLVIVAFGQIIPVNILKIPPFGAVNIHPSLLPAWRGASPIQTVLLHDQNQTGVTLMLLDEGLDSGPILSQKKVIIRPGDNAGSLHDRLAKEGAELLIRTLPDYLNRSLTAQPQDHSRATFTRKISKEDGRIDWTRSAEKIASQIRAFTPWPGVYTSWQTDAGARHVGKRLKIVRATALPARTWRKSGVGHVERDSEGRVVVLCSKGRVVLERLQLENKKPQNVSEFIRGARGFIGGKLL